MNTETKVTTGATATTHDIDIELPHVAFCRVSDVDPHESHHRQLGVSADTRLYTEDQVRAAIEADRKRRGEPVLYTSQEALDLTSQSDAVVSVGLTRVPQMSWHVPLYAAPQPAESCASLISDKTACGSDKGNCDSQPAEPDSAKCAECGAELIPVRPGKWQHPDCSQSYWTAEPEPCFCDRMYPDSNPDVSCGDCPTRDYKEPMKDSVDIDDLVAAFIARGDITKDAFLEARQWVRDTYYNPAEMVKVPSDTDIDDLSREWGLASAAYPSKSMVRDFARALLAHYR